MGLIKLNYVDLLISLYPYHGLYKTNHNSVYLVHKLN